MDRKESSLRESLDEAELDRLSFVVYKKTMSLIRYTGTGVVLVVALFAYFGFDQWKNIPAHLDELEKKASEAEARASSAERTAANAESKLLKLTGDVERNGQSFQGALNAALIETGEMRQVRVETADLRNQISKQQANALGAIKEAENNNRRDLEDNLKVLQVELGKSAKRGDEVRAFQANIKETSKEVADKVDRSLDAGFTVLILQDKHSTTIQAKGGDLRITLGNAKNEGVGNVEIQFGAGHSTSKKFLRPNDEISFSRLDTDGKPRKYSFKILDINVLAFRDLVTCEVRWELATNSTDNKVAQAGS